jgi:hypothetical protein
MIACFQPSGIRERRLEHLLVERPPRQVDRERVVLGELSDATDLSSHLIGVSQRGRNAAETARRRDGSDELRPDVPRAAQRSLNHRMLDAECCAECCLQLCSRLLSGSCSQVSTGLPCFDLSARG